MLRASDKAVRVGEALDPLGFQGRLPFPTYVGAGGGLESQAVGSIASRHASIATGDIELVAIESNFDTPGTISTAGWTQVSASPQQASDTSLAVWWHRFTSGDALPTIDDVGDHMVAYTFAFRGCGLGGRVPIEASAGSTGAASTTFTGPSVTAVSWNTMIVSFVSITRDANATDANFGGLWFGNNIALGRAFDRTSTIGAGGGFGIGIGLKTEPGATGTFSGVIAVSAAQAMVTMALR